MNLLFYQNKATEIEIYQHLINCNLLFVPPLDTYVSIEEYAFKISEKAIRFEAFDKRLIGLIALYYNKEANSIFITNVSVEKEYLGKKIGITLLQKVIDYCKRNTVDEIILEVHKLNHIAIAFYGKMNFYQVEEKETTYLMKLEI